MKYYYNKQKFLEKQEKMAQFFKKLEPSCPITIIRENGEEAISDLIFTTHCPICGQQTKHRAILNNKTQWSFATYIGIHRCNCWSLQKDGYTYFNINMGIWYKKENFRIVSFDKNENFELEETTIIKKCIIWLNDKLLFLKNR